MTDASTELTPTTKHSAGVGHEAEFRWLIPEGGVCADHERPPVVVVMMVVPAPMLPVLPTAAHASTAEQEMLVTSTALDGGVWVDHVAPLSDVANTYGVELRFVPTAMQDATRGQTTALSCLPAGSASTPHEPPPSDVVSAVPPPPVAIPTAVQFVPVEQDTPDSDVTKGC